MLAPKVTFSCKGYFFFQIVILNARLWFAFSPPSLYVQSAPAGH